VSMVFQSYALFPHMTVLENVRYGLIVSRMAKAAADERARAALTTVGLTGYDTRLPSELSGGQQQRVAVARALVLEPSVLLFDEPLSNLDARLRRQMREEIRDLQQRLSLTVVYVTHDQAEAMAVSDRIIVMNRAVIAQEGAPRELYEEPRDPFVAGFMGDANRVRGRLRQRDARDADVHVGPVMLVLPHRGLADGEVELAIRPEAVTLRDGDRLPLSYLFLFLGASPCTDWLGSAVARDDKGFVLTGADAGAAEALETSVPGVYAAGDVRSGSLKRCATAVGEGATVVRLVHDRLSSVPA